MKIRSFKPTDTHAVIDLWKKCGLIVPWNDPHKDIKRKIKDGTELFLVGEHKQQIIAVVMGGYDGHRGWVNYLAVAPKKQGQGLARLMMNELEIRLIAIGCPKLNLQVRETNVDVINFYQALGYTKDACLSLAKRLIKD